MSRKAFEEWDRKVFDLPDRYYSPLYQGDFPSIDVKARWQAWQAATAAALERAEKACEAIEIERWALYKGRPPYTGTEQGRADNYVQGESGGAGSCASAIRALKDET